MMTGFLVAGLMLAVASVLVLRLGRRRNSATGNAVERPAGTGSARPGARSGVFEIGPRDSEGTDPSAAEAPPEALKAFTLRRAEALGADERETVDAICRAMPEPHPIQARVAAGLDSPEELKLAVSSDPGLTAAVLRTVNSAAIALATPITSVQQAITYLGVNAVKGLVVQAAVAERVPAGTPERQAVLERIWKAARVASAVSQSIGQGLALPRPSVVGTSALFANLGDIAIALQMDDVANAYSEGTSLLARIDAQQRAFGANTFIVGSALARYWDLPATLAASIEQAGLPLVMPPAQHPLQGERLIQNVVVYVACRVGDAVAYRGLSHSEELDLQGSGDPDGYFLGAYLQRSDLSRLVTLFDDPGFRRTVNRLITTLA